jgi:YD repeat-containing protein
MKLQPNHAMGRVCLLAGAVALLAQASSATAFSTVEDIIGPQGFARRWEAGMPVGLYSQVNLHTGRMITALPIVGWSGKGPSIGFALYHNMTSEWKPLFPSIDDQPLGMTAGDASGDGMVSAADIDPFVDILLNPSQSDADLAVADLDGNQVVDVEDLGSLVDTLEVMGEPQWTHSYSAQLTLAYNNNGTIKNVTLTREDGTQDVFTRSGSVYGAPAGVYDKLQDDGTTGDSFTLTTKSQWKAHFIKLFGASSNVRRLDWIADATVNSSGQPVNKVTCVYINAPSVQTIHGKLSEVHDAAGRILYLTYNEATGNLIEILDPASRHWKRLYADANPQIPPSQNGTGRFVQLLDPMTYHIDLTYTNYGEIASIADKDGHAYSFTYNESGELETVTDPARLRQPGSDFHVQHDHRRRERRRTRIDGA